MANFDCCCNDDIACLIKKYIGQTVTIFTKSGGPSGAGFTGVVICVDECVVKLITRVGAAPSCPIGSDCTGYNNLCGCCDYGYGKGGYGYGGNFLGSVTAIPIDSIASFVHNAI